MSVILQFLVGLVFGVGLLVAGMSDPAKVLNFLDVAAIQAGTWDPSLIFVMAGAIAVALVGYKFVLQRQQPLFGETFHLPSKLDLDARIISGSAIFGVGWGLVGFCPGPAFTALGSGAITGPTFIAAMVVGMVAARWTANRQEQAHVTIHAS